MRSQPSVPTKNAWAFFGLTILEAILICVLEGVIFYFIDSVISFKSSDSARTVLTYLIIYIFASVFQVVLTFMAIRQRNTIQIIGLVIFNATFIVYSAMQISEVTELLDEVQEKHPTNPDLHPILIIIPVITGICQIFYVLLAHRIYKDFGWLVFKRLGADRKIHRYYFYYEVFCCLLKFVFFFFVGFTIQLLMLNLELSDVEAYLTLAAVPVSIVFIVLAVWSVRHEVHWVQVLFDVVLVGSTGYFAFKLWRIWGNNDKKATYQTDQKSLTVFASIALVLILLTLTVSIICEINFGKGLKRYLVPQKSKDAEAFNFDDDGFRPTPYRADTRILLE